MMLVSVKEMDDRLQELGAVMDTNTHLSAEKIGWRLHRRLNTDYSMDPELFRMSIEEMGWRFRYVGEPTDPVFALVYTPAGMFTLTKDVKGEASPLVQLWLKQHKEKTMIRSLADRIRTWFN
jgi:hypothetical protein